MIAVDITDDMVVKAKHKTMEMGRLNKSILNGAGTLAGFIGEQVALQVMGGEWSNTYDYDIVLDNGQTVDVKTKQTSVPPLSYYECSVAKLNTKQKCDIYAFVRVKKDLSVAWFLGSKNKAEYFENAVFKKKGDKDGDNNFVVRSDCYNMAITDLDQPS
jgi:hypothetical protein